ncbi:transglycosylase SLT domain-containing protein [Streptomyces sp. NPDC046876]|uniref:transglycosylase SLT domain-containing protein n=1 Tax=Streptomyces sp. NPDC046876 TaxID=3155616 RepID=UPI00340F0DAA
MYETGIPGKLRRLTKTHKMFVAAATMGAAALAATVVPAATGNSGTAEAAVAAPAAWTQIVDGTQAQTAQISLVAQQTIAASRAQDAAAAAKAKAEAEAAAAAKKAREAKAAASRSAARKPVYANNLDGWIKESLAIMKEHKIPGTYNGLYKNIMRESSGNPRAINLWDINAKNGVPSIGLLQIIKPTFLAYHVPGTPLDQYHPVANIVAAANYAADRYGSIDNVNSAY